MDPGWDYLLCQSQGCSMICGTAATEALGAMSRTPTTHLQMQRAINKKSTFFFHNNLESEDSGLGNASGLETMDVKEHVQDILEADTLLTSARSPYEFPFCEIIARTESSRVSLRDPRLFRQLSLASAEVLYGSPMFCITDPTNVLQHGRNRSAQQGSVEA